MFNLQGKMDSLLQNLDDTKKGDLMAIEQVARDLPSLTAQRETTKRTGTVNSMQSVQEDPREHVDGTRQNPFTDDPELAEYLDNMGYRVDMVLFGVRDSLVDISLAHVGSRSSNMWR
jgi:hypothetical protein